jgi:NADPH:quinone reductase-like Zn-dependent oxidoreductase
VSRTCSLLSESILTIPFQISSLRARYVAYKYFPTQGAHIGCDYTGEVVKLGSNLKVDIKVGDKVSATIAGSKYSASYPCVYLKGSSSDLPNLRFLDSVGWGAFTEYSKANSDVVWKIPEGSLSFEQAVATGSPYVSLPVLTMVLSYKVLIRPSASIRPSRSCSGLMNWD